MKKVTILIRRDADTAPEEMGERFIKTWKMGLSCVRSLARELERDVKRMHEVVSELIACGFVAHTEGGKIHVPYNIFTPTSIYVQSHSSPCLLVGQTSA